MSTKIQDQSREQIAEFLPEAIRIALNSYQTYSIAGDTTDEAKFKNHHAACKIAISKNQGPDLAKHLEEACEHGEIVCKKLKPGHESRWRLVTMSLKENNAALLEQVYAEVKRTRQELINDLLFNKGHGEHHEKH